MPQSGEHQSSLPIAALVVTALAAGGFFALQEPLSSLRHKERVNTLSSDAVQENVDARLWQDPMQVVHSDWNRLVSHVADKGQLPPSAVLPQTIGDMRTLSKVADPDNNQLRIVVMMPGNPYADDAEHRRRQRYALVSALSASGYNPRFGDRIGYFIAPGMKEQPTSSTKFERVCTDPITERWLCPLPDKPLIVGFESFTPDYDGGIGGWKEVMVLWLSRRELGQKPLQKLLALTDFFKPGNPNQVETVLLGPDDSGGLIEMFNESDNVSDDNDEAGRYCKQALAFEDDARAYLLDHKHRPAANDSQTSGSPATAEFSSDDRGQDDQSTDNSCDQTTAHQDSTDGRRDIHILSPRSTVPLDILFPTDEFTGLTSVQGDEKIAAEMNVISFHTVLSRDDVVIANIIDELRKRGLNDCRSASGIAVVSEIDSSYGRALPEVVQQVIEDQMGCKIFVHAFGYLRGVDGELPPSSAVADSAAALERVAANTTQNSGNALSFATGTPDRAAGVAQTDYIRRLADHIAQRHVALSENDNVGFRAIGILGTDVYDKQLILHALRDRLPAVTFFTTDLDARLNAPDEFRWSRNLLIGSAYGLTPPEAKIEAAPLRDSYQMAFFLATKLALTVNSIDRSPALFAEQATPPPPRLFEIGRSGAIDITVCDAACLQKSASFGVIGWVRYAGGIGEQLARTLFLVSPLLVLAMVSLGIKMTIAEERCKNRIWAKKRSFYLSFFAAVVIATILWSWDSSDLEPWLLTEGISSVPTLMLHVTSIVYSLCFVLIVWGRIKQSNTDCEDHFQLIDKKGRAELKAWHIFQTGWTDDTWLGQWVRKTDEARDAKIQPPCSAKKIWLRYRRLGKGWSRALRVLPVTFFWTVVVSLVLSQDANPLLARDIQGVLDVVRILTVFFVLGVIFLCVDSLRLGRHLIRALAFHDLGDWCNETNDDDCLDGRVGRLWRKMELIVMHSELLNPFLVLPFILLFLLILARLTLFEGWIWTPGLIAVYLGFSIYLLVRALLYQREAVQARDSIIDRLERLRIVQADEDVLVRRTEFVLEEIRAIHHGAFVPWTRHPIVQSIIVPTGGVGVLSLFGMLA